MYIFGGQLSFQYSSTDDVAVAFGAKRVVER